MDSVTHSDQTEVRDIAMAEQKKAKETNEDSQMSSSTNIQSQDETSSSRSFNDDVADEEGTKKKKRKENSDKDTKPGPASKNTNRNAPGTKVPGPASKTGVLPVKNLSGSNVSKSSASSGKNTQNQGKSNSGTNKSLGSQGKSGSSKGISSATKTDRKSPVSSPKSAQSKENAEGEDESKSQETSAPKVPPLKIVIPGGACGSNARNEGESDGLSGARGAGKGRNSASTLPYIIPCTSSDAGLASDSSDGLSDDKKSTGESKAQRVLRSHRTADDKERTSPQSSTTSGTSVTSNKSEQSASNQDDPTPLSGSGSSSRPDSTQNSVELHPRKRKIKASREAHVREPPAEPTTNSLSQTVANSNPYQMYIQIKKQIYKRQKSLFPVKPKPPKDFNNYLMNRCTYTLQGSDRAEPPAVELPASLPPTMKEEYISQEAERHALRNGHQVEKEKLVLAVEQEILRVHGGAERAVANQSQPYSVCTILRDQEVYNLLAPEQEEKRNAQRSRCNGRQINSWLQEVDDKWEKIKEGMVKRQHREAETLYASQTMDWEWKMKETGLCDYKLKPTIEATHVPQVHVSNFDLPA